MPRQSRHASARDAALPLPGTVALVLQGGGALGSFQAGVVESLHELGIPINWVAGISIGAVNAALIAGNPPEKVLGALRGFWELVSGGMPSLPLSDGSAIREAAHLAAAGVVATFGVPGFFRPHWLQPWMAPAGSPEAVSYYDTTPLRETLDRFVDWDRVNHGPIRFSVGAVDVETGNLDYFCTTNPRWKGRIDARHVMASGALPPGLPPIEIDGRHYWDGGIVSNMPLSHIVENQDGDTLVFQCDLFPAEGPLPTSMTDTLSRARDIQYSSRTRQITDQYLRLKRAQQKVQALMDKLPPEIAALPEAEAVHQMVNPGAINIVHLIYRAQAWERRAKDFEFSRITMLEHWEAGQAAVDDVIGRGNKLLAQNIIDCRSATFDLTRAGDIKEKQA